MHIINLNNAEYENFSERGATKVKRKTLVDSRNDSYRFYLRYYSIEPGGMTPYDVHNYEHILIITKGRGSILTVENNIPKMIDIKENDIVFIKAKEPHQIINTSNDILEFYCFRGTEILYSDEIENVIKKFFNK
jgi:mannose-6-phosphate isomerase-like protein (cupin superfamily)